MLREHRVTGFLRNVIYVMSRVPRVASRRTRHASCYDSSGFGRVSGKKISYVEIDAEILEYFGSPYYRTYLEERFDDRLHASSCTSCKVM